MNWKLRLQNKTTLTSLIAIVVAAIYQVLGIFGIVPIVGSEDIIKFAGVLLTALAALGIVVDPTTTGVADSDLANSKITIADTAESIAATEADE